MKIVDERLLADLLIEADWTTERMTSYSEVDLCFAFPDFISWGTNLTSWGRHSPDKIGKRGEYTVTEEDEMLRHYREIFYGLIFGLGAACIDTFVDASTEHKAFWDFGPGMLLYRGLFILFGFLVGWLL